MKHYKPKTTLKKKIHHIYLLETVKHRIEFPEKIRENHKYAAVGYKDHRMRNQPRDFLNKGDLRTSKILIKLVTCESNNLVVKKKNNACC